MIAVARGAQARDAEHSAEELVVAGGLVVRLPPAEPCVLCWIGNGRRLQGMAGNGNLGVQAKEGQARECRITKRSKGPESRPHTSASAASPVATAAAHGLRKLVVL